MARTRRAQPPKPQRPARAPAAIAALNSRLYPKFPSFVLDWDGRPIPKGFGPAIQRMRRAGPVERRVLDPGAATDAFLYHLKLGLHYGYPECCALQYSMEAPYVSPLQLRGGIMLGDHVPCDDCLEAYLRDYLEDGEAWKQYPGPVGALP